MHVNHHPSLSLSLIGRSIPAEGRYVDSPRPTANSGFPISSTSSSPLSRASQIETRSPLSIMDLGPISGNTASSPLASTSSSRGSNENSTPDVLATPRSRSTGPVI